MIIDDIVWSFLHQLVDAFADDNGIDIVCAFIISSLSFVMVVEGLITVARTRL
jgi:hypothetical protein